MLLLQAERQLLAKTQHTKRQVSLSKFSPVVGRRSGECHGSEPRAGRRGACQALASPSSSAPLLVGTRRRTHARTHLLRSGLWKENFVLLKCRFWRQIDACCFTSVAKCQQKQSPPPPPPFPLPRKCESLLPVIFILLLLQKGTSKTVNAGSSRCLRASPPRAEAARRLRERLGHSRDERGVHFLAGRFYFYGFLVLVRWKTRSWTVVHISN